MLYDILKGKYPSSFILIEDSLSAGGTCLLQTFIQEYASKEEHKVHVLCYENPPSYVIKNLNYTDSSPYLQVHDCCTDHRRWSTGKEEDKCLDLLSFHKIIVGDGLTKFVLIVDSLSVLMSNIGVDKCLQQIHQLIQGWPILQLICLVHRDFIPNPSRNLPKLCHLATTVLQVLPSKDYSEYSVVLSRHIQQGGTLTRSLEQVTINGDNELSCKELNENKKDVTSFLNDDTFMKTLTTFKIELEKNEQDARNNAVLPYLKNEDSTGRVFYEPDQADDWDDDDPDDDLDI